MIIVLIDQLSKFFALRQLAPGQSIPVIPEIFHLTLVHNPGIAFGLFRGHETLLLVFISASLLVLVVIGQRICSSERAALADPSGGHVCPPFLARWGMSLILGGAVGNWIDRLRWEAVIDFLDFRIWPVFNFADSAITIGVVFYLILLMRKS